MAKPKSQERVLKKVNDNLGTINPMDEIKLGGFIRFGQGPIRKKAIISTIYDQDNIEVVYLDDRKRAINEDMVLKGETWEFKHPGPSGGYADKNPELRQYIQILKNPRL